LGSIVFEHIQVRVAPALAGQDLGPEDALVLEAQRGERLHPRGHEAQHAPHLRQRQSLTLGQQQTTRHRIALLEGLQA
jgi:hypothetical protein